MLKKTTVKPLRWQRPKYSPMARQIDVFLATWQFLFYLWWDRLIQDYSTKTRKKRAKWLIKTILELGPTFIKIGQSLSTRSDLLPKEYVDELCNLQDKVPPFSSEAAIALVESELGKDIYQLYRDFEHYPIAAASLGQVHKARLHTGEDVVVKVQRPGLKNLFDVDVQAVHKVIRFCQRYFSWARKFDLDSLYQEFFHVLYQEIDYIEEGKNAERFSRNFQGYPQIVIPKIYWRYTTQKIITIEYLPGIKVDDTTTLKAKGIDLKRLNQLGICCYLKQLLQDGFFQADPHPGNMAVTLDGSLIFYDFGMMAEVKTIAKEQMIKTFFAVLRKDTDTVLETLIMLGLIEPVPDMMPVRRLINFLLDRFTEKPVDFQEFNQIKDELYIMFEEQPFRLPSQMMFIMKSLTTLDGIARILEPDYNFMIASQPFVKSITVAKGRGTLIGELARQTKDYITYRWNKPSRTDIFLRKLEDKISDGELQFRVKNIESERAFKRIQLALKSIIYACVTGFSFLSGSVLLLSPYIQVAIASFAVSIMGILFLTRSLFRLWVRENLDKLAEK